MRLHYVIKSKINWRSLSTRAVAQHRSMDQEQFKKRLSEVAIWEIPKTPRDTVPEYRRRNPASLEELYEQDQDIFENTDGINTTMPIHLKAVKCQPTVCEDCGKHCPNGRKKEAKVYQTGKNRHWRQRCVTCDRTKNPYTGQYDLDGTQSSHVWNSYLRGNNQPKNRTDPNARNNRDSYDID